MLHYAPGMKKIPVGDGKFALVDDDDYEFLQHFKWHLDPRIGHVTQKGGREGMKPVYMRRLIMEPCDPFWVICEDGNPLNCQKENLVIGTPKEAMTHRRNFGVSIGKAALRRKRPGPAARYVGVIQTRAGRFQAGVKAAGHRIHLGTFTTPEAAALAYNAACRLLFPEGTRYLNDVPFADYPEFKSPRFLRKMERLRDEK